MEVNELGFRAVMWLTGWARCTTSFQAKIDKYVHRAFRSKEQCCHVTKWCIAIGTIPMSATLGVACNKRLKHNNVYTVLPCNTTASYKWHMVLGGIPTGATHGA